MSNVLWIWDVAKLEIQAIIWQIDNIKIAKWDPVHPNRLALCTGINSIALYFLAHAILGNDKIYFWRPEGCSTVAVPGASDFSVFNLEWNDAGTVLALYGKNRLCCCYLPDSW